MTVFPWICVLLEGTRVLSSNCIVLLWIGGDGEYQRCRFWPRNSRKGTRSPFSPIILATAMMNDCETNPMSWLHCHFPNHTEPPWTLRSIPGQGYAAFANRDFAAGDLILTETPTVWVQGHHPFTATQVDEIERKISLLSEQDRLAFYAMANVFNDRDKECWGSAAAGIFLTNSFDMVDAPHGKSCAMYCAIGRLNHSCVPNVQQTHIPETSEEVLYACRTIAKVRTGLSLITSKLLIWLY